MTHKPTGSSTTHHPDIQDKPTSPKRQCLTQLKTSQPEELPESNDVVYEKTTSFNLMDQVPIDVKFTFAGFFHVETFTPRIITTQRGKQPTLGRADGQFIRPPDFLAADHTQDNIPHWHIMFKCVTKKKYMRCLERIIEFLDLSKVEKMQLKSTLQEVKDKNKTLLHFTKFGIHLLFPSATSWQEEIEQINNLPQSLHQDAINNEKPRAETTNKRRLELIKNIKLMIRERCHPPYSWKTFLSQLTEDEYIEIHVELGSSHPKYMDGIIDRLNQTHKNDLPAPLAEKLQKAHIDKPPTPTEVLRWLEKLFQRNSIDPAMFWKDLQGVHDKELRKRNAFVIRGPPNCFKSTLLRLLLKPLHITPMSRSSKQNDFRFQSLLNQDTCLWEEPVIQRSDVDDWKLLFEGVSFKVSVKNQPDQILERTPFFITTNHPLGRFVAEADCRALKERYIEYLFTTQIDNDKVQGRFPACPQVVKPHHLYQFFISASENAAANDTKQKKEED